MSTLNLYNDYPTILSSSDTRLLEVNNAQNLKKENILLTNGIIVLFIIATSFLIHASIKNELNKKNKT